MTQLAAITTGMVRPEERIYPRVIDSLGAFSHRPKVEDRVEED